MIPAMASPTSTCLKSMEKLEVRHVSKSFDGKPVLQDISMELNRGELVCLLGVSGGGKTTLFNVISGLLAPDEGQVLLDGTDTRMLMKIYDYTEVDTLRRVLTDTRKSM